MPTPINVNLALLHALRMSSLNGQAIAALTGALALINTRTSGDQKQHDEVMKALDGARSNLEAMISYQQKQLEMLEAAIGFDHGDA